MSDLEFVLVEKIGFTIQTTVFEFVVGGGRGPTGEKGEQGDTGATGPEGIGSIDYSNPITLTGTITPTNGQLFTTDSKLVTLTGNGGEKFWPDGGATSRKIWGSSSGAALPVVINPSLLGIGGVFEIAIDDGESRKIRYDGTDFVKFGEVYLPWQMVVIKTDDQTITAATITTVEFNSVFSTTGGPVEFDSANFAIKPLRDCQVSLEGSARRLLGTTLKSDSVFLYEGANRIKTFSDSVEGHSGTAVKIGGPTTDFNALEDQLLLVRVVSNIGFDVKGTTTPDNSIKATEKKAW